MEAMLDQRLFSWFWPAFHEGKRAHEHSHGSVVCLRLITLAGLKRGTQTESHWIFFGGGPLKNRHTHTHILQPL